MPIFLRQLGPAIAFGIPGVLMFISTVILWLGRKQYVMLPPAPPNPHSFLRVSRSALTSGSARPASRRHRRCRGDRLVPAHAEIRFRHRRLSRARRGDRVRRAGVWMQLDAVRGKHPAEAINGVRSVLRVLVLFALVTPFWSLFDQKASTWVLQANAMSKPSWFQSSQMQALNPALVMLLIPFNNLVLYPALTSARLRADGAAPDDGGHRVLRDVMDRGRRDAGGARIAATPSRSRGRFCRMRCSLSAKCSSRRPASSSPTARRRSR